MSKKVPQDQKYLENLVRESILKEKFGARSGSGMTMGDHGGLPTWEGTKKWWSGAVSSMWDLGNSSVKKITRDMYYKDQAPLQGIQNVKLGESKKYEHLIKSFFMFFSNFKMQDFNCDEEPQNENNSLKNSILNILLLENQNQNKSKISKYKKSCDYFANYTGWGIDDITFNFLLKGSRPIKEPDADDNSTKRLVFPGTPGSAVPGGPLSTRLMEQPNLNTHMDTGGGQIGGECPDVYRNDKDKQKAFCTYRAHTWLGITKRCMDNPKAPMCRTSKEDMFAGQYAEDGHSPSETFEKEVVKNFEAFWKQSDGRSQLGSLDGELKGSYAWTKFQQRGLTIHRQLESEVVQYFAEPHEGSTHSWLRFVSIPTMIGDKIKRNQLSESFLQYLLVPEKKFVENMRVLDEKLEIKVKSQNFSCKDKDIGIDQLVPDFALRLLSVQAINYFYTAEQIIDMIFGSIDLEERCDNANANDEKDLRYVLQQIKKQINQKIINNTGLHTAFFRYLMMASLSPSGEVTESEISDIENAKLSSGDAAYTTGQQLLSFLVVTLPESMVVDKLMYGTVQLATRAGTLSKAPAPPWVKGVLTATVFVGQIVWFFTDPINKFDLSKMKDQYNSVLKQLLKEKETAIKNRYKRLAANAKRKGKEIDQSKLLENAKNSFKFNKEQINTIKSQLERSMEELKVEIDQSVEMTISNFQGRDGISSDNLEKRLTTIRSFVAVGAHLKKSLKQMNKIQIYINADNFSEVEKAIKETRDMAEKLFNQAKVADTGFTLQEQKTNKIPFLPSDPDGNIDEVKMHESLVMLASDMKDINHKHHKLARDWQSFIANSYYRGPFKNSTQHGQVNFFQGSLQFWKGANKEREQIKFEAPREVEYQSILSNFNVKCAWAGNYSSKNPDIQPGSAITLNFPTKGFTLTSGRGKANGNFTLIGVPYAFGYDGILSRYGCQGNIFLSELSQESFGRAMKAYFVKETSLVTKKPTNATHITKSHSLEAGAKWYNNVYKYKKGSNSSYGLSFLLADRVQNIYQIIHSLEEKDDWETNCKNAIKVAHRLTGAIDGLLLGEKTDYPQTRGRLTRSDLEMINLFFKSFIEKSEFDLELVKIHKLIKKVPNISDGAAFDKLEEIVNNKRYKEIAKQPCNITGIAKTSKGARQLKNLQTQLGSMTKARLPSIKKEMISFLNYIDYFVKIDNITENIS